MLKVHAQWPPGEDQISSHVLPMFRNVYARAYLGEVSGFKPPNEKCIKTRPKS